MIWKKKQKFNGQTKAGKCQKLRITMRFPFQNRTFVSEPTPWQDLYLQNCNSIFLLAQNLCLESILDSPLSHSLPITVLKIYVRPNQFSLPQLPPQ